MGVLTQDNQPPTFFARTNFRGEHRVFGIKQPDRRAHMYVIGKTGTGKSTMLEIMVRQDVNAGRGLALLDPHGDLVERVLAGIPAARRDDLVYLNVPDVSRPLAFNPLEHVPSAMRPPVASGLLDAFKKVWADSWGPRMEYILRNALLTLLDQPHATLADVLRLLHDHSFRQAAIARVENLQVREFWLREYEQYPKTLRAEAIAPIQNKVGAFITHPVLNKILTQPRSAFNLRRIMDEGKILLVNLAKGKIGEDAAALFGALLVSSLGFAGLTRADVPEGGRRDFYLYMDEFQTFTTQSVASMLSELRKYHVSLILAHQYLAQVDLQIRDAILGNVGTIICFRLGLADAEVLAKEFHPKFSPRDLIGLPNYAIYLKLMIDGGVSRPFSADTLGSTDLPC